MTSENTPPEVSQDGKSASENTKSVSGPRRGRAPIDLPADLAAVLGEYVEALAAAPLAPQSRRTYASKVRQYLAWVGATEVDADPLTSADGRDWAMRDY